MKHYHFAFLILIFFLHWILAALGLRNCPPLPDRSSKNVLIKCKDANEKKFECEDSSLKPLPQGTLVTFGCPQWFRSNQDLSTSSKNEVSCGNNGKWNGLKKFLGFTCIPECGKVIKLNGPLIANVESTTSNNGYDRLPWELDIKLGQNQHHCKGTLIPSVVGNASAILTSRDCINQTIVNPYLITVDINGREHKVKRIKAPKAGINLAILFLQIPVSLSHTVLPACLPSYDEEYGNDLSVGQNGLFGDSKIQSKLTIVGSTIFDCSKYFSFYLSESSSSSQFCTDNGHQASKIKNDNVYSSCSTLGAGFFIVDNPLNGRYSIAGVQSIFPKCKKGVLFTKLEPYMDYITELIESELDDEENVENSQIEISEESLEISNRLSSKGCSAIKVNNVDGFSVQCSKDKSGQNVDCSKGPVPPTTVANYTCKDYFSPSIGRKSFSIEICKLATNKKGFEWSPVSSSGFSCQLNCGLRSEGSDTTKFITEGFTSSPKSWPWIVSIYGESDEFICAATLISQNVILTAGHCLTVAGTTRPRQKSQIRVQFGKFSRKYDAKEDGIQQREIKKIHIHEHYNNLNLDNDIAIGVLNKPVEMTQFVRPVCLPSFENELIENEKFIGSLVGWGRLLNGSFPEDLQEAKIPFVDYNTCKTSHPTFGQLVRPSTNFCAGYKNMTGACDGDSGGGLYYRDPLRPRTWVLVGIVSGGVASWSGSCQVGHYSVFTKVANFKHWIEDALFEAQK